MRARAGRPGPDARTHHLPNGDVCQFQDITFRCRATGGEARANDNESLEVAWFEVDALPPLESFALDRIHRALRDEPTWFEIPAEITE